MIQHIFSPNKWIQADLTVAGRNSLFGFLGVLTIGSNNEMRCHRELRPHTKSCPNFWVAAMRWPNEGSLRNRNESRSASLQHEAG